MAEETILDLVHTTSQSKEIGFGGTGRVYPIADEMFSDYVFKIHHRALKTLDSNTCLTPIDYYGTGYGRGAGKLAPRMMEANDLLEIQPREIGTDQLNLWRGFTRYPAPSDPALLWEAHAHVLRTISRAPLWEYVGLLDNMNWLTLLGHGLTTDGENLLISPPSLRWVDIQPNMPEQVEEHNNLLKVREMLLYDFASVDTNVPVAGVTKKIIGDAEKIINDKLDIAASRSVFPSPQDEDEVEDFIKAHRHKITFKPHSSVESMTPIPLGESPATLRAALDEMEKRLGLTFPRK